MIPVTGVATAREAEPTGASVRWSRPVNPAAVFFAGLLATAAPAQEPPAGELMGIVRTGSGRPVERAALHFSGDVGEPGQGFTGRAPGVSPHADGSTGRGGRFRFDVPVRSGSLWVTTADGLGAVIPRAQVGTPLVVTVEPLGSVQLEDDSRFRCLVQVVRPGGTPSRFQDVPSTPDTSVRLPAGKLLLLLRSRDAWIEHAVQVEPGQRTTISSDPPRTQPLPGDAGTWELDRWPGLPLPFDDGAPVFLAGPTAAVQRFGIGESVTVLAKTWWDTTHPPSGTTPTGSLREVEVRSQGGGGLTTVTSTTWAASPGGLVKIAEGESPTPGRPAPYWVPNSPGATRVVLRAPGHRPGSFPLDALPDVVELTPTAPCLLRVRVPGMRPAEISVQESGDPYTRIEMSTDARGMATLPYTPTAEAEVTVLAPGCTPLRGTFRALGLPDAILVPEPGRVLRGRVVDADGQPVPYCEVEVRDPSGNRLPSPRQTVSAEDGTFGVEGLADGTYTIQAHDLRNGRTFSGQTRGAQPGRDTWEVVLRDEDPARPGSRAEKRGGP